MHASNNMYGRDIFLWRVVAALFWSIGLQTVFLILCMFLINFNPWHPVMWIQQTVVNGVSWLYMCPLALVVCGQGLVSCKDYVSVNKYYGTRFSILCNLFSFRSLLLASFHTIMGGFITWMYLSLVGGRYGKLSLQCSHDESKVCLNEGYLFLTLNGFWIGIFVFIRDYFCGPKALIFPVVHQLKFLQVKARIEPLLKEAMLEALTPTFYFFIIYYWNANVIQEHIKYYLGYDFEEQSSDVAFGLMNLRLLLFAWFFTSVFIFTMYTMKLMFQVNLTEHTIFPITPVFGNSECIILSQALAMANTPIIQYLGYLDLKTLAEKDRSRREELFTLSQPGGHPYNWNAVVEECLKLIRKFVEDLNVISSEAQSFLDSREQAKHSFLVQSPVNSTIGHNVSYSGMRNMTLMAENLSNTSFYNSPPNITRIQSPSRITNTSQFQNTPVEISQESLLRVFKMQINHALSALCKKPGISFIFGEIPDAKLRHHLIHCQPVIWAVQGLSRLASASFKEDCYGVVQKDLPAIITVLLQLKQSLDKLQKIGNYKKLQKTEHQDTKMKNALRSSVKQSLYCICITFGDYIKEVPLTKDVAQQIQHFLMFREG